MLNQPVSSRETEPIGCIYLYTSLFFGIAFLWDWNENWPFPVLWPLLSFPNLLVLSQHHLSGFGIAQLEFQSPPLALLIVMLSKAHLTSHYMMSGSRWVIIPLWLSGLWRSFLYSPSVYSCHLFLISSASVRSIPFLSFIELIFAWNCSLGISNFLEGISSLSHAIFFLYSFALIAEEGLLTIPVTILFHKRIIL